MGAGLRCTLALLLCASLAGCATTAPRPDRERLVDSEQRAERLAQLPRWSMQGRIAVSDGRDGGSGRMLWQQDAAFFDITVRAPVAGGSWRLSGGPALAQLDGVGGQPRFDADAEALLARELGWHLPMTQVGAWVRGLPADAVAAQVTAGPGGLPARILEAGWAVEYRDWLDAGDGLQMPRRLLARKAPFEVRIAIDRWSLNARE